MSDWLATVHAHCLETGEGVTCAEAEARFGKSAGAATPKVLGNAKAAGIKRAEKSAEPVATKHLFAIAMKELEK